MHIEPEARQWYVCYCSLRGEYRAQAWLRERGFDAYCPSETRWARHAGKREAVNRPYLPRYIFVGVSEDQGVHDLYRADGVERVMGVGDRATAIPYRWVGELRAEETKGTFDFTVDRNRLVITPGKPVRVIAGPFRGFLAQIVEARGDKRVRVLLHAIGKIGGGKADIDVAALEAA